MNKHIANTSKSKMLTISRTNLKKKDFYENEFKGYLSWTKELKEIVENSMMSSSEVDLIQEFLR